MLQGFLNQKPSWDYFRIFSSSIPAHESFCYLSRVSPIYLSLDSNQNSSRVFFQNSYRDINHNSSWNAFQNYSSSIFQNFFFGFLPAIPFGILSKTFSKILPQIYHGTLALVGYWSQYCRSHLVDSWEQNESKGFQQVF